MTCFTTTGTKLSEDKVQEQKHSPHQKSCLNFQRYFRPGTITPPAMCLCTYEHLHIVTWANLVVNQKFIRKIAQLQAISSS